VGRARDGAVKFMIGVHKNREIGLGILHRKKRVIDFFRLLVGSGGGRRLGCGRLEHHADLTEIADKGFIDADLVMPHEQSGIEEAPVASGLDADAGFGADFDQSLGGEDLDGFPENGPADTELPAEIHFGAGRSVGGERAIQNANGKGAGYLIMKSLSLNGNRH